MNTETTNMTEDRDLKERLVKDLNEVVTDAEDLLKATKEGLSEKAAEAREKLLTTVEHAKRTCSDIEGKARYTIESTDKAIRENPYRTIGFAFGIGLLIGILVNRK
ncbi:MAG: DUF883 family protein [Verrucomicrobia bacterium]|nr:DUF883 family protein [Verrucomicrobiota bacterium]MCF7709325.1 DUF883 family protein [Verrucomicrobiota bacterium]